MARVVERFITGVMLVIDLMRADDDSFWEGTCDRPTPVAIFECMFHSSRMMLMLMITSDADDESSLIYQRSYDIELSVE